MTRQLRLINRLPPKNRQLKHLNRLPPKTRQLKTPQQTTAQDPTTQTHQHTAAQDPTTQTPQQTTAQDPTTQTLQQTTAQDPTTKTHQQTTTQDPTTQTPQQTTAQDPTTQTPLQTTAQYSTIQTPRQTTAKDSSAQTPTQTTSQVSTTQTPTKSSVFSLAKDNKGRNLIGYCLTDHVMETVQIVSLLRCTMMCKGIVGCKSFNYKGGICELNDKSKESVGSRYFVQSDGCTYYELACLHAVNGVTRACQPRKHHLKSSVFSMAKDNEGRNLIGYCLTEHVMDTVPMVSLLRCTMVCKGIAGCRSFNYKGGVCELNDESKESAGSAYLVQSDGCTYYELA